MVGWVAAVKPPLEGGGPPPLALSRKEFTALASAWRRERTRLCSSFRAVCSAQSSFNSLRLGARVSEVAEDTTGGGGGASEEEREEGGRISVAGG